MIVKTGTEFLAAFRKLQPRPERRVTMRAALLISPSHLRISDEATADNAYMQGESSIDVNRAMAQHQDLAAKIAELGVPVVNFTGVEGQDDGVFPNNVFGTSPGRFIVGSMYHPVRKREAIRKDVRAFFLDLLGYELRDLSSLPGPAELTGSLVIDHSRNMGFCGLSTRSDEAGCRAMHEAFALDLSLQFELTRDEYHSNIILAVLGSKACVLYPPSFEKPEIPDAILRGYENAAWVLSDTEKSSFAGNCIAVTPDDVLFSETSHRALRPETLAFFESRKLRIHAVPLDEIEKAGGSLRCTIAEIF